MSLGLSSSSGTTSYTLLTSEFDDDLDEYPDEYEVFIISDTEGLSLNDWKSIEPLAKTLIGSSGSVGLLRRIKARVRRRLFP